MTGSCFDSSCSLYYCVNASFSSQLLTQSSLFASSIVNCVMHNHKNYHNAYSSLLPSLSEAYTYIYLKND